MFDKINFRTPTRMARLFRLVVLIGVLDVNVFAATGQEIRLWSQAVPGSETWARKEVRFEDKQSGGEIIRNVVEPTLTIFLPPASIANGTAVIVCPGGAFQIRPDRIGLLGFSAGAAIAIDVAVQHEPSTRPNFSASIYGPGLRGSAGCSSYLYGLRLR